VDPFAFCAGASRDVWWNIDGTRPFPLRGPARSAFSATLGWGLLALGVLCAAPDAGAAQEPGGSALQGEWHYLGGDVFHQRYSALDQIDQSNFEQLEVAWIWRGDNFSPSAARSTPSYVDGVLYTVVGERRTVVAIDGGTGETLWTYREPHTTRWERSTRKGYGKGVSYGEVDGRGVIFISTPAFFLHALDAETGRHLEGWGTGIDLPGFPDTGVLDLLPDLLRGWGTWEEHLAAGGAPLDTDWGIPAEIGNITSSSPPIVVNGVVVVGNSSEQGYRQVRMENVPGDILAYDARTGDHMWKFHVIPRPGEIGHETWENDAWRWTGDVSSWAPMSADPELGLVYFGTNGPTNDYWGGFRPGDNLFGSSIVALDVQTGAYVWHFQTIYRDLWNFDIPMAPLLIDVTVEGRPVKVLSISAKNNITYILDRETGEPLWPFDDLPVPPSHVPGEIASPVQPFPTRPPPIGLFGLPEEELIDFTPELREEALEILEDFYWGVEPYTPFLHVGNEFGKIAAINCPAQGANINAQASADPETGIMYVSTARTCRCPLVIPGVELEDPDNPFITGRTTLEWAAGPNAPCGGPQGLPLWRPPYGKIVAIDVNTGEILWWVPNGDTPANIRNHPALAGLDIGNTGAGARAPTLVTSTLLVSTVGGGGQPYLHAHDKRTGERLGTVELPAVGQYGLLTYLHEGSQYIVVQVTGSEYPNSLVALRLP